MNTTKEILHATLLKLMDANATNYVVNVTNDTGASLFNVESNGTANTGVLMINGSKPMVSLNSYTAGDILAAYGSGGTSVIDSGINVHGPVFTNGFASLATGGNTITVNATGLTNTETTNLLRVIGFQGTSVVLTNLTTHSSIGPYTYSSPTDKVLQPNEALIGTGCSGSCTNL